MSYTVTIRVLGPLASGCRPPFPLDPLCARPGFYTVAVNTEQGSSSGGNVCIEHLYPSIGFFLGLPEAHAQQARA
jgi:hypothetical protein